jgi:outer membrane protein assembly factor BamB
VVVEFERRVSATPTPNLLIVFLVLLLTGPIVPSVIAQEWTRFRGPNGSGVGRAANLPIEWKESDFNWRVPLPGIGHSSPVLWGERLFVTSADEETGRRHVLCLDAASGQTLWSRSFDSTKDRKHELNSFASSTPAVDETRVYVSWATPREYIVLALDHRGEEQWRVDLGPYKAGHGAGVSPIVFEDMVIVGNDQEGESSIVALDRQTGSTRWRVPRKTKVAYATPCVYRTKGRPAELVFTNWEHGIMGIDPRSGATRWEIQVFDQKHVETSIGSPIVAGDLVLGTCGWLGYATHTVAVRPGAGKASEVFRVDRGAPLSTTPLAVDGLVFLWGDDGIVTCVDAAGGKQHWQKRVGGTFYSSPVAAAGRVYCPSRDGEMIVLAADNEYRLLARNPLGEGSHSTPAIAHGRMYVRTFSHLISLGGRGR